jgi:hypothetical protein
MVIVKTLQTTNAGRAGPRPVSARVYRDHPPLSNCASLGFLSRNVSWER